MNAKEEHGGEGRERMTEKGNENAPGAAERKAKEGEESSAGKETGRSPGPAPMGGGDQKPTEAAGSKVQHVGDEKDPELGRDPVRRISSHGPARTADTEPAEDRDAEPAQDADAEPGRSRLRRVSDLERTQDRDAEPGS